MSTYVLIHGAWHGGWCWEKIIPLLQEKGHRVFAPDLPGHGEDKTSLVTIGLQTYVESVCQFLDKIEEPVILVGHSFGGVVISQVAEYRQHKIKALIYVAAFLPKNAESMFTLAQYQPPSRFVKLMKHDTANNTFYFPSHAVKEFAYNLCDEGVVETIKPRLCIEPLAPILTCVKVSAENLGSIPKKYIQCTEDKAIHLPTQIMMCDKTPCQVFQLISDHSPFYSQPQNLVQCLLK